MGLTRFNIEEPGEHSCFARRSLATVHDANARRAKHLHGDPPATTSQPAFAATAREWEAPQTALHAATGWSANCDASSQARTTWEPHPVRASYQSLRCAITSRSWCEQLHPGARAVHTPGKHLRAERKNGKRKPEENPCSARASAADRNGWCNLARLFLTLSIADAHPCLSSTVS